MTVNIEIDDNELKEAVINYLVKRAVYADYLFPAEKLRENDSHAQHVIKRRMRDMIQEHFRDNRDVYDQLVKETVEGYLQRSADYKAGLIHKAIDEALKEANT